ncbi:Cell division protein ZipA [Kluyvera cryocrescens]|uniref:Cell division protein ZipA n=1 Tax=Kluyvera cryocrescens TaxID=580 RepID=A0A485AW70_KLUCR|nr:Cell division protein ZipA [Kluyvera cryocrescens]
MKSRDADDESEDDFDDNVEGVGEVRVHKVNHAPGVAGSKMRLVRLNTQYQPPYERQAPQPARPQEPYSRRLCNSRISLCSLRRFNRRSRYSNLYASRSLNHSRAARASAPQPVAHACSAGRSTSGAASASASAG